MKRMILALSVGILLNTPLHADDYQFPQTDGGNQPKQAAPKQSGPKQAPKAPKASGPDLVLKDFTASELNQCDSHLTQEASIAHPVNNGELRMDLTDVNGAVGTTRRLECASKKGDPNSYFYVTKFELREAQDKKTKSWEPLMICGDVFQSVILNRYFKQFIDATWLPNEKEDLVPLKKGTKNWLCINHYGDNSMSMKFTWSDTDKKDPEMKQDHDMVAGYTTQGYESRRTYEIKSTKARKDVGLVNGKPAQDLIVNREVVFNKSISFMSTEVTYAKDNLLANPVERTVKLVIVKDFKTGRAMGYESAAIDGNTLDRNVKILQRTQQGLAPLIDRDVSVKAENNNAKGWFNEIVLETTGLDEKSGMIKSERSKLTETALGSFLLQVDDIAAGGVVYMLKSQSDAFLRDLASHYSN